jgi:septal ring factor EnvC (AmiA/AmiB activator)
MAFRKACFMADPSMAPETPDVAETVSFLRRFADLMSNGYKAAYLHRAAELLETMTARVTAASDEEDLWRYKYETLTHHADALEAECDALKNDVEGHLDITFSIMAERDALAATLQAREAELSGLRDALNRERDERVAKWQAQEEALAGLRGAFGHKLEGLQAALDARGEECDQLCRALERERDDGAANLAAREGELSGLRLAFDRERAELQARLEARGDELAAFRMASEREHDTLKEKVASLEAKRAELRSAFDRIGYLRNQTIEPQAAAEAGVAAKPGVGAEADPPPAPRGGQDSAVAETNAVVPKATLRQARDQFEYLARQFIPLGDIASQVMCELGAYTMDLTLAAGQQKDDLPVGEVARSILAPSDSPSLVVADRT